MKRIVIFLFIILSFLSSPAQPGDYNGPAKISVTGFWTQADNMRAFIEKGFMNSAQGKVSILEKHITTTKTKDPSYSTASMEAELKKLKELYDAKTKEKNDNANDQRDKFKNQMAVGEQLRSLFGAELVLQVDAAGLKTIKERIDNYKKRTEELLAMDRSESQKELDRYLVYINGSLENSTEDFKKLDDRAKTSPNAEYAEVNYYELLYHQAYWDAAKKIYPDKTDFANAYAAVTKIMNSLGSIDDLHAAAEKNRIEKVKNTKMPVASVKDATLEKLFMDAFNTKYKDEFKGTAIKAVVTTKDWSIKRNELTGIVLGRQREGAIAYKGSDGKCYLITHFNIFQDYVGGAYQGTKSIYVVHSGQEMLCENAK
jgi:hypothetical protein